MCQHRWPVSVVGYCPIMGNNMMQFFHKDNVHQIHALLGVALCILYILAIFSIFLGANMHNVLDLTQL